MCISSVKVVACLYLAAFLTVQSALPSLAVFLGASSEYKPSSSMASVRLDWIRTQVGTI